MNTASRVYGNDEYCSWKRRLDVLPDRSLPSARSGCPDRVAQAQPTECRVQQARVWTGTLQALWFRRLAGPGASISGLARQGLEYRRMQDYKVQLDSYSGPLDLLLYLIRRDEIDDL